MTGNRRRNFLKMAATTGAGVMLSLGQRVTALAAEDDTLGQKAMDVSFFPCKTPGVNERVTKGVTTIAREGRCLELNGAGAYIWRQIDGSKSMHHLAQAVAEYYRIDFSQSLADCQRFVGALTEVSFLELPRSGPCYQFPA